MTPEQRFKQALPHHLFPKGGKHHPDTITDLLREHLECPSAGRTALPAPTVPEYPEDR